MPFVVRYCVSFLLVQFFRRERERKTADDNIVIFSVFDIDTHTQRGECERVRWIERVYYSFYLRARARTIMVCLLICKRQSARLYKIIVLKNAHLFVLSKLFSVDASGQRRTLFYGTRFFFSPLLHHHLFLLLLLSQLSFLLSLFISLLVLFFPYYRLLFRLFTSHAVE